jgi:hypothetical protein
MSRWTHAMCRPCWDAERPGVTPIALRPEMRQSERCCFCGNRTRSGIYYRADPNVVQCRGEGHGDG